MVVFRPVRPGDVEHVAARMRPADVAECIASGVQPLEALVKGVQDSPLCWTAEAEGEPAAILGAAPLCTLMGASGAPWLLGTSLVTKHQRAFIRAAPGYIVQMLGMFSHLLNFVHAKNTASMRWLRSVGFELYDAAPYGPSGEMFHRFEMHADGPNDLLTRKSGSAHRSDAGASGATDDV